MSLENSTVAAAAHPVVSDYSREVALCLPIGPRVVGIACVAGKDQLLIVTEQGQIIRLTPGDLRPIGRDAQGVRLMDLAEADRVVSIAALTEPEDVENDSEQT
jgi:DNA gyrase/topoisomerase IV subunit A